MLAPPGLIRDFTIICVGVTFSGASASATSQRNASPMAAEREVSFTPTCR
jgi:hypothetical protein